MQMKANDLRKNSLVKTETYWHGFARFEMTFAIRRLDTVKIEHKERTFRNFILDFGLVSTRNKIPRRAGSSRRIFLFEHALCRASPRIFRPPKGHFPSPRSIFAKLPPGSSAEPRPWVRRPRPILWTPEQGPLWAAPAAPAWVTPVRVCIRANDRANQEGVWPEKAPLNREVRPRAPPPKRPFPGRPPTCKEGLQVDPTAGVGSERFALPEGLINGRVDRGGRGRCRRPLRG